jgi:hypothetical protein
LSHLSNARAVDGNFSDKESEWREPNKESEFVSVSKLSDARICARQASRVKTARQRVKRTNEPPTDMSRSEQGHKMHQARMRTSSTTAASTDSTSAAREETPAACGCGVHSPPRLLEIDLVGSQLGPLRTHGAPVRRARHGSGATWQRRDTTHLAACGCVLEARGACALVNEGTKTNGFASHRPNTR